MRFVLEGQVSLPSVREILIFGRPYPSRAIYCYRGCTIRDPSHYYNNPERIRMIPEYLYSNNSEMYKKSVKDYQKYIKMVEELDTILKKRIEKFKEITLRHGYGILC